MKLHPIIKVLLSPLSLLYGIGIWIRNISYDKGWVKSIDFNFPIISIGNLSVGGTGKTPHTEYMIRLLRDYIQVAVLSRGYGRKSKGFIEVFKDDYSTRTGDEPLQVKRKLPDTKVYVSEDRVKAISAIIRQNPELKLIILDDAFQHRAVNPGLEIILTPYDNPYSKDYLLPSGTLREWRSGAKRADAIVVTKCPRCMSLTEMKEFREKLRLAEEQHCFFSAIDYLQPYNLFDQNFRIKLEELNVILFTAIANEGPMLEYIARANKVRKNISFRDHHEFTGYEMSQLKQRYDEFRNQKPVIICTEKDVPRLEKHFEFIRDHNLPVFVLPISIRFLPSESATFDDYIKDYLLNFMV